jgi:hypothetical protein
MVVWPSETCSLSTIASSFMLPGTLPQKGTLYSAGLKAKYFPNTSFWLSKI